MDATWETLVDELTERGDYPAAVEILRRELGADPGNRRLHDRLGRVHRASGDHAQAVAHFSEAARLLVLEATGHGRPQTPPCFEDVETGYGAVLPMVKAAHFDDARAILGASLEFARIRNDTGMCLLELGDIPVARRMFCEAVEFIPAGSQYDEPWTWLTRIEDL